MRKKKPIKLHSLLDLESIISFGDIQEIQINGYLSECAGTNSVFNSLVDELEEHNKKVKQHIKNYDRL